MPVGKLLRYAIKRDRSNGLNQDDAVKDQVPQRERATQTWKPAEGAAVEVSMGAAIGLWKPESVNIKTIL